MICLIGATGYMGQAFAKELHARKLEILHMSHKLVPLLLNLLKDARLVINCAAFIPSKSVSLCDEHPKETIMGNMIFPMALATMCSRAGVPLMHLSTGCLYDSKREYSETDKPMRGFGGHCSMYLGTKLLSEEAVSIIDRHYILRIRLPFDEFDNERNYLSKIQHYPQVYDHLNSLTHRADFVKAALDLWEMDAPFGTYHMVNEGSISARHIINKMGITKEFVPGPCAGTTLSIEKLLSTGVKIRHVEEAVDEAIRNWKKR